MILRWPRMFFIAQPNFYTIELRNVSTLNACGVDSS